MSEIIGGTPLVAMTRYAPDALATIVGKCEFMNPLSVKDRAVLSMIRRAEERGELKPGDVLIEATSGNTGMALAFIGSLRGYKVVLCMSQIQSLERRMILAALGAELVLTPAELGTKGAKARAMEIHAATPGALYICQHDNPDNRSAHLEGTGPEIWDATDGQVDIFVGALGTCATVCGVSEALKARKPEVQAVGVEPLEAPMISEGRFRPHRMMGTSPGFIPGLLERELIDEIVKVSEDEAFDTCRSLARTEGMLVGISSGATAFAAAKLSRRPENAGKLIVCLLADSGERYLSVDGLFDRTTEPEPEEKEG